ncbi:MAG: hypothetical protein H6571_07205 [Lewinellaceae bacterium]|nr:hypothetical protein [Lewinellaceae bacterium]
MKSEKIIKDLTIASGVAGLIINGLEQWTKIQNGEQEKFDFVQFLGTGVKGAAIGFGVSVTIIGISSLFSPEELDEEDFDEIEYLEGVLASYKLDSVDQATMKKGFSIKNKIYNTFKGMLLGKPKFQGSIPQGTALSGISDLDILIKFKKNSFSSLEEMYLTTLNYFKENFQDSSLIEVRPQRRSIGLIFNILGEQVCIDVVPARRTNFKKGGNDYNLYENPSGLFGKPSRVKMNPHKQAYFGAQEKAKANVVSLLKVLKVKEEMPLKPVLIKELILAAFSSHNGRIPQEINKRVVLSLEYIRDNIEHKRVVSPDNSNNVLSDSLTRNEKRRVANTLDSIILDIKEFPSNLKYYFPQREDL